MNAYSTARKRRRDRVAERIEESRQTADILRAFLEDADRRVYTVVRAVSDSGAVRLTLNARGHVIDWLWLDPANEHRNG